MNLSEVIEIDHRKFCEVLAENYQKFYDCEMVEEIWQPERMLANTEVYLTF